MLRVNVLHISCFGIGNNDAGKTISAKVIQNQKNQNNNFSAQLLKTEPYPLQLCEVSLVCSHNICFSREIGNSLFILTELQIKVFPELWNDIPG